MNEFGINKGIELNEYQRAAVEDESRACLVKANVGSGKTTVLVEKLHYLHEKKGVPYEQMVVLTFTNKAANEIMERLGAKVQPAREVQREAVFPSVENTDGRAALSCFGTFHSVALSLLRERLPIEKLGYAPGFAVIDPDEELDLAISLIEEHGLQIKYKNRLKKRLEQEEKAWRHGREQSRLKDDLFSLFPLLEREKVRLNKFSFADLIRVATQLVRTADGFEKPAWIVVDEVQDSDRQQLDFISALMGDRTHLFAVGDPNQVIYSWRGGAENIFFLLSRAFDARELTLPVNYRSNASILDAARSFQQGGDRLQGVRQGGSRVQVRSHYDPFSEAQYLADKISGLIADGVPADEIAIFYRLQSQSEMLEKEFDHRNIPYRVSLKRTASDLPVIRWLIRVLRYACNPQDHSSALAALMDKTYGPGLTAKKARAVVEKLAVEEGAGGAKNGAEAGGKAERAGIAFLERARRLRLQSVSEGAQKLQVHGAADGAQELYTCLELDAVLNPATASYAQEKEWVLEFLEQAAAYRDSMENREDAADIRKVLNEFLNSSALYGLQIGKQESQLQSEGSAVRLMTLHASKGLEFQRVFIIGVNYGLIPLANREEGDEEEERRLFFVGMTRAKDHLELSSYINPGMPRVAPGESRYISMIPAHLLCRQEQGEVKKADLTAMRRAAAKLREEKRGNAAVGTENPAMFSSMLPNGDSAEVLNKPIPEESAKQTKQPSEVKEAQPQRVRHARYGVGTVMEETDSKIKVMFDGFGEKEFVKAFAALEKIPE